MRNRVIVLINVIAAIISVIGCLHLPIGYYTFLRIVIFVVAVVSQLARLKEECVYGVIINGLVAILFNPIIPVYLHNKTVWIIIDIAVAAWFGIQTIILLKNNKNEK